MAAKDVRDRQSLIGLSTYAYLWQWSPKASKPLGLDEMLRDAADQGADVFQICDYPSLETMTVHELGEVRALARELNLVLEVGTRGVRSEHLRSFLAIANHLGVSFVRSMIQPDDTPLTQVPDLLREVLPEYRDAGVELGLETYEQLPTATLTDIVDELSDPQIGVVLDPGNCVAALERPGDVIEKTAPYVKNLHVKDFAFTRQEGWVGFVYAGARLGEGLLDYDAMVAAVDPHSRGINQIIEHWLPWQGDSDETIRVERDWIRHNIHYLRNRNP